MLSTFCVKSLRLFARRSLFASYSSVAAAKLEKRKNKKKNNDSLLLIEPIIETNGKVCRLKISEEVSADTSILFEAVIGLEIHAQIHSKTKIFSGSKTSFASEPNSCVSFLDAGYPGTLPVINSRCVEAAIMTGLALDGQINTCSQFDRKHYFYGDLPLGYQITQQMHPIVIGAGLQVETSITQPNLKSLSNEGRLKANVQKSDIRISRIQLEQDSGKSIHDSQTEYTLLDLNRAGAGLMEIVTEPDFRTSLEVVEFLRKLQGILVSIGTCDGKMAEGSLRCDANVSINILDSLDASIVREKGVRCEVKNISSPRFVAKAINFEIDRQLKLVLEGTPITAKETRMYDARTGSTFSLRRKEDEKDYRYMPEPDLPPLTVSYTLINQLKSALPELPEAAVARLCKDLGLSKSDATILVYEPGALEFYESAWKLVHHLKNSDNQLSNKLAQWVISNVFSEVKSLPDGVFSSPISAAQLADLVNLVESGKLSQRSAKDVFAALCKETTKIRRESNSSSDFSSKTATDLAREMNVLIVQNSSNEVSESQETDDGHVNHLENICRSVIDAYPKEKGIYLAEGREGIVKFLLGKVLSSQNPTHCKIVHLHPPKNIYTVIQQILDEERKGSE